MSKYINCEEVSYVRETRTFRFTEQDWDDEKRRLQDLASSGNERWVEEYNAIKDITFDQVWACYNSNASDGTALNPIILYDNYSLRDYINDMLYDSFANMDPNDCSYDECEYNNYCVDEGDDD